MRSEFNSIFLNYKITYFFKGLNFIGKLFLLLFLILIAKFYLKNSNLHHLLYLTNLVWQNALHWQNPKEVISIMRKIMLEFLRVFKNYYFVSLT
jgi:hypothetical protein